MESSESDAESTKPASRRRRSKKTGTAVFDVPSTAESTPAKRKRGRPPGSGKKLVPKIDTFDGPVTPTSKRITDLQTLSSSARKGKEKVTSEKEGHDEEDLIKKIREEENGISSASEDEESNSDTNAAAATPSKGTPRKRKKARSPTPPQDLAPHERYFWQTRSGRMKTSNNTLSIHLLNHEEYNEQIAAYKDPHSKAYENLFRIHTRSFPQWRFELSEDFNICLYGYGSKRRLVTEFAQYLYDHLSSPPKIFIINGYTQDVNLRHIFTSFASLVWDCKPDDLPSGLGSAPTDILSNTIKHLTSNPPKHPVYVFINSLDAAALRRSSTALIFARLAAHPAVHMLATCDTPNFPLLWDVRLQEQYNWVFHDTTTFQSYAGVEIPNVVDEVNDLLGRSGRSIKGKGGAGFVLKSLPENARNLYRVLIAELLSDDSDDVMDIDGGVGNAKRSAELGGLERKTLYNKAVEDFICSNEMGFGQLLNEFYDHDMLIDKDVDGTKVLGVPWRREECEELLEELMA